MIERIVIFGAGGDLAGRYLLPALAELDRVGNLPDRLQVVGAGRQEWDDEEFRAHAAQRLERHAADLPAPVRTGLLKRLSWRQTDVTEPEQVRRLVSDQPTGFYLALPPAV